MLIDTHAHLTWDSFKPDFQEVVDRAKNVGITHVINIGADLESSKKAAQLECPEIKCYSSVGLHPHEVSILHNDVSIHQNIDKLKQIYNTDPDKIVAVGECGLDFHFENNPDYIPSSLSQDQQIELQRQLFLAQIALAKQLYLPLIIHSRDSWQDIFVPELNNTTGVFHSFTGNSEQAQKVLNLGYYLGFTCIVTYPKNEYLREIIKSTPIDKILTETDCPFLPPQSQRGQRNEPANVLEVVKIIAQMKNLPYEKVAEATFQNAQKLFKLA